MHKLLFLYGILFAAVMPFAAGAGIYKSVDEDGNVTFSDTPSPGAEEIEKKEIPTVPTTVPEADFSPDRSDGNDDRKAAARYRNIAIVSPENDTAIRENSGQVSVNVALEPALAETHEVVIYMDGSEAARSQSTTFRFSNVDRGTHTLTAAVIDGEGGELIRSRPVTFTLHRHSVLHPNPANPGAPANPGPTPTNPPKPPAPSGPTPTNPPTP